MSDSIIIPSYTAANYSYTDSVVPSSVFTSYSLPRHHAAAYDDEADYPLNYEASPVHQQTSDDHDDAFPSSSLLTSADVDNKESSIYDCHVTATVTESELFESQQKSFHDTTTSAIATNETSSIAYRNMKMKYLRSAGVAIPRGVVGAHAAARRLSSSPSYDVTYDEEVEETRGRTESSSSSPLSISSSSSSSSAASSAAPSPVPKSSSIGLLARLLSERVPTAPSTPTTLSPSSSSTSLVSMSSPSSPVAAVVAVDASSAAATPYVRRTSPISIPKRIPARGDDTDGVRYRRARQPTRDELDEEERHRQQRLDSDDMYDSRTIAGRRVVDDGEFTFADVFAVPLATSSRPIAINNKKPVAASARRLPVIPAGSSFSMGVSHALPSSLIDGFLAL